MCIDSVITKKNSALFGNRSKNEDIVNYKLLYEKYKKKRSNNRYLYLTFSYLFIFLVWECILDFIVVAFFPIQVTQHCHNA